MGFNLLLRTLLFPLTDSRYSNWRKPKPAMFSRDGCLYASSGPITTRGNLTIWSLFSLAAQTQINILCSIGNMNLMLGD